jgi:hypothetical protein
MASREKKHTERVSIAISKAQLERVRYMAIQMSYREKKQIGVSEAIRMAIEAAYPVPKEQQLDLFK